MIITRTPFRISFAGGGSDLQSFYRDEPGMVISAAIAKYMYLVVKPRYENTFRVSYAHTEICASAADVQHPIVRECLQLLAAEHGLEIVSMADLPAGSGMGSSSCFTVGLLLALHAMRGENADAKKLARLACEVEIERVGEPIGKQDQYIAAYGGLQFIQFMPDGGVYVDPVICPIETKRELNRRLMLFTAGGSREARTVLTRQNERSVENRPGLRRLCGIARSMREVLTLGRELNEIGRLLNEAWEVKKGLEASISNPAIDAMYQAGRGAGALGGKLLGAGSGGFMLFYCEPHLQAALRQAMRGSTEIPFSFEPQGSKIIYVGEEQWDPVNQLAAAPNVEAGSSR